MSAVPPLTPRVRRPSELRCIPGAQWKARASVNHGQDKVEGSQGASGLKLAEMRRRHSEAKSQPRARAAPSPVFGEQRSTGLAARWTRHRPTELGSAGSSPAEVAACHHMSCAGDAFVIVYDMSYRVKSCSSISNHAPWDARTPDLEVSSVTL